MTTTDKWKIAGIIATLAVISAFPLYMWRASSQNDAPKAGMAIEAATFVGSQKCAECHKVEFDRWKGSHHDLAMDEATEATVLGNFDNAVFTYFGIESRFYRQNGRFFVYTQGPDGTMGDFEVQYVFGVYPLQQYLIPFPGGRLQCLPIAWDARQKRWYHLYPEEPLDPKDWLYWTNAGQNWNGMCAECHSTNLKKNYDPEQDVYQTTWSEIDVGCEACHGPGSRHVAWAELPAMARPQTHENYELTVKTKGIDARAQVELCAPCHSRRAILGDYTHHEDDLLDSLLPTLLNEGLYFSDGQILDEVYVYGSFTQSKMYHRNVRCSDCHDVHSIKPIKEDNALCLQCHKADVYDTKAHHFHKQAGEAGDPIKDKDGRIAFEVGSGAQCVECHMPGRNYMGIDYRPDHSFRIPRPDLSARLGVPNACNRCHWDKTVQWADDAITKWYGPGRSEHYGMLIDAGRKGESGIADDLMRLVDDTLYPVIIRATALQLLGQYSNEKAAPMLERALVNPEALIRQAAVTQIHLAAPEHRQKLLVAMLYDPVKAVRIEAANQLSRFPDVQLPQEVRTVYETALAEYVAAMTYSADFAFGRFNLGNLYANQNRTQDAIAQYRKAIRIDDQFYMAKVNLAMAYNQTGDNSGAEKLFREVLNQINDLYEVHYSLGLLLAEEKRYLEAVEHLAAAAQGMPNYPRVHYNLGQLLDFLQESERAQNALERSYRLDPQNPEYIKALVQHYLRRQKYEPLEQLARQLLADDATRQLGQDLAQYLKNQGRGSQRP